jgi:Cu2+-containing amine oxidase
MPYRPDELLAAGDYPNRSPGGKGLVQWTEANPCIILDPCVTFFAKYLDAR